MHTDITKQPISFILLQFIFLLLLFWARYTLFPEACELVPTGLKFSELMSVYGDSSATKPYFSPGMLINGIAGEYYPIGEILSILILFINGFIITKIISVNLVFPSRTYISYLIYIIVCCGLYFPGNNLAVVIASYLILRSYSTLIESYAYNPSFGLTFKGTFMLGITPLLHPQAVIYILMIPIAMRIYHKNGREIIIALFGALLPSLILAYIFWVAGGSFTDVYTNIWDSLWQTSPILQLPLTNLDITRLATTGLFLIITILSIVSFMLSASEMRTRAYRIQSLMLSFLILGIISIALPFRSVGDIAIVAIPIAFLMPSYFIKYPSPISTALYILLLSSVIGLNILPFVL